MRHIACLQAAKELETAEVARKEAKKEAASKATVDKEVKKEAEASKLTKSNSNPSPRPKARATHKADADKGTKQGAGESSNAADDGDDECTPRDADGNELAVDIDANKLTAAQLQEELTKRGLDVKWQPLKGKKVLVERLQVTYPHLADVVGAR